MSETQSKPLDDHVVVHLQGPSPHHPHDQDDEVPIEEDDPESDLDLDMEGVIGGNNPRIELLQTANTVKSL